VIFLRKLIRNLTRKIILSAANRILAGMGGRAEVDGIYLVRMSREFKDWTYSKGYKIFKEGKLDEK
jgi:hypothetical protein